MNSKRKWKLKIIVMFVGMAFISLTIIFWPYVKYILYVLYGNFKFAIDARVNKQILTQYLQETYNDDLKIVNFEGGKWDPWGGRRGDILTVQSKDHGNYLFSIRMNLRSEKTIVDERNSFHYGYYLKKYIYDQIISQSTNNDILSYATIHGTSVNEAFFAEKKDEINATLTTLYANDENTITYQLVVDKDTISDKKEYMDMMYEIYEYLWKTKCDIFYNIKVVDNDFYTIAKDNLGSRLDPFNADDNKQYVRMNLWLELRLGRLQGKDINEDPNYLSNEEFYDFMNREWNSLENQQQNSNSN